MDTETRAAIEHLRAYFAEMDATSDIYAGLSVNRKHYPGTEGGVQREHDLWKMAKLCLSLVRADDTEAISEDWLRECGFCACKGSDDRIGMLYFDFGPDEDGDYVRLCVYPVGDGWNVYLDNLYDSAVHLPRPPQTKGDLRQLMRGFGQEI